MDKVEYWKAVWFGGRDVEYYCAFSDDDTFMYLHLHHTQEQGWRDPMVACSWKDRKHNLPNSHQRVERLEVIVVCGCLCPLDKGED
jgi:hypothetical protein